MNKEINTRKCRIAKKWFVVLFMLIVLFSFSAEGIGFKNQYNIKLIDLIDKSPISDAHVCIELENGRKSYAITDEKGEVSIEISMDSHGIVVISKIGFVTRYFQIQDLVNISEISLQHDVFDIEQVVITGQIKPVPADSSIYKVKLITEDYIRQSGAVNLNELLVAQTNIRMSSDLILGSQIEMLGMSGQSVKIMIDGVPVIGRLDGNVDLSQINLADIVQVEVVEGPMSVVYGNNALAGTINLITKANRYEQTSVKANAYAESVGRLAGNANVSQRFGDYTVMLDGGYEYFSGVDFDETSRSMDWKPKKTYRAKASCLWKKSGWDIKAKIGVFDDELWYKSDVTNYKVYDEYYYTNRFDVNTNVSKTIGLNHINVVAAYNYYNRAEQALTKDLAMLQTTWYDRLSTQKAKQKMLRGIYTRKIGLVSLQTGMDLNAENMSGPRIVGGSQYIGDYASFVNIKYQPVKSLEIQPGFRAAYNTKYDAPLVYSLNAKWDMDAKWNWRASVAKGFRAPDLKELHYEFVDSNHEIYGNSELEAESSFNYNTSVEFAFQKANHGWMLNASAYYNDAENMISLIQDENSTRYTYQNIDNYKSKGLNVEVKYVYTTLISIRGGYGITGRYNSYSEQNGSDKYNVTHDVFGGFTVKEPTTQILFALDYKLNGKLPFFYADSGNEEVKEGYQDAFHTMNVSGSYSFYKNHFQIIVGAKNLFDVTNVNQVSGTGGAHSGGEGIAVSYGRSYFINLVYKFNKVKY